MSRSKWKGPYTNIKIEKKKSYKLLIASRNSEIIPKFVGKTFKIHNGKTYFDVKITKEMIGYKFGEFVFTRSVFSFKKKSKK